MADTLYKELISVNLQKEECHESSETSQCVLFILFNFFEPCENITYSNKILNLRILKEASSLNAEIIKI